jgi:hypothetical protein
MRSQSTSLEKKKWYRNAMAVITAVGAVVGIGVSVKPYLSKPKPVQENTEIVLDRSDAMNAEFEGTTKFQAAIDATRIVLGTVSDKDNLALRQFGGLCAGDNTRLSVEFKTDNVKRAQKALAAIQAGGQTSLAHAVIEAIGDFNDPQRFKGVGKRIVVITGSDEGCLNVDAEVNPMEAATAAIRDRLERSKRAGSEIQMDFRFVGIGLTPAQQENVSAISTAVKGRVIFVHHRKDLEGVLRREIVAKPGDAAPVSDDATSLVNALNANRDRLQDVLAAIGKKDYSGAETSLQQARQQWTRSEQSFREFGNKQSEDQFKKLYELAGQNREIENRLMTLAETMLSQARSNDRSGYNASKLKFDGLSSDYERNAQEINQFQK